MRPNAQTLIKHIQKDTFWESEVAFLCEKTDGFMHSCGQTLVKIEGFIRLLAANLVFCMALCTCFLKILMFHTIF